MTIPEQLAAAQAEAEKLKTELAAAQERADAAEAKYAAEIAPVLDAAKAAETARVKVLADLTAEQAKTASLQAEVAQLKESAKQAATLATEAVARVGVQPIAPEGKAPAQAADLTLDEIRAKLATATGAEKSRLLTLSAKLRGTL